MALLRRVGSLKRNNNTYLTPRKPGTDNAERPKGMFRCHVTLLDDTVFTCDVDKHSNGDALLNEVFTHMDILERDYFGLAYQEDLVMKWLDPTKGLKKQFKGTNVIQVNFRVKFYVTDPERLHEELTRYQFYLQVKKDLLTTRLPCSLEAQALLGAHIIQAELGDFDPRKHSAGYVSHYRLVAKQTHELEDQVCELHKTLVGKGTAEAEFHFLTYARRLEFYGVELFRARDQHGVELGLGITCNGISVYKGRTHITTFSWAQVLRITYKRKKFYIELREDLTDQRGVVGFYMDTQEGCKQLWKNCIEFHAFFHRLPASDHAQKPQRSRSKSFRRKSRGKSYVERTETQAVEATRAAAVERSKSMKVVRKPSGSFRRLKSKTPSSRDTSPEGLSKVRRVQSLGKDSHRPILRLPNGYHRESSTDREFEDEHELSVYSPEMAVSDDMTGQFSLVQTGTDPAVKYHRVSIASSVSIQENGPTEFYDDRNALEARLSHVSSEELAAEGLLLVKITSDHNGKYGFIVKGGSDENMPVIVTKVSPGSPAATCSPPLEEGDQVLYINGKSVADKPHDKIITLIKTSSELVIVMKPRNLQKVHPSLHVTSTVTSPPAMVVSSPKGDPGHMLRESLTSLKASLTSGKGQLHFDRLYRRKPGLSHIASKLPQNLVKNRYRDILAYDETRVLLQEGPDYINANYVNMEVYGTGQIIRYIAAQGPMQHTSKDLWQMIWEERVTLLVMLTELIEVGKVRCCRYWPELNCTQEYGKYGVTTVSEQKDRVIVTRQIRLKNKMSGEERTLIQMQYTDWPDHGIPGSKVDFLRFIQGVRSLREDMSAPIVVHCSAGIGRTGVLIMLETALCKMEALEAIYPLDIVRHMRDQRGMLVQTPLQYEFVCESIIKAYEDDYVEIELPARRQTSSATAL